MSEPRRSRASWGTPVRGQGSTSSLLDDPAESDAPAVGELPDSGADLRAGLATTLGLVLLGAPVGLLWALVAPKVTVLLSDGTVMLVDPDRSAFIAGDAYFLGVVLVVGLASGVLAWLLGRRHGPAVVVALTVGGLLAAYVAARTGALLHEDDARSALEAGLSGEVDLAVRLRASEAMLGWPVGALVGFLVPALLSRDDVSSG